MEHRNTASVRLLNVEEEEAGEENVGEEEEGQVEEEGGAEVTGEEKKIRREDEAEVIRKVRDLKTLSPQVVEEHWLSGHVTNRDWCEICVQARGREDPHKKGGRKERALPEYAYDYCPAGDEIRGWQRRCRRKVGKDGFLRKSVWIIWRKIGLK